MIGACAERGRLGPILLFVVLWSTFVYDPIAYWSWSDNGWARKMGVLDYAGGGVVHMTAGTVRSSCLRWSRVHSLNCAQGAMAYAYWLGKRQGYGTAAVAYRPSNISHVVLGTVFLLFGWQGALLD